MQQRRKKEPEISKDMENPVVNLEINTDLPSLAGEEVVDDYVMRDEMQVQQEESNEENNKENKGEYIEVSEEK